MKAGETVGVKCRVCNREFDILLEPKSITADPFAGTRWDKGPAPAIPDALIMYCAFCGSGDIDTGEE